MSNGRRVNAKPKNFESGCLFEEAASRPHVQEGAKGGGDTDVQLQKEEANNMNEIITSTRDRARDPERARMMKQPLRDPSQGKRDSDARGQNSEKPVSYMPISDKERTYFEYAVETEPMVQDFLGLLIDGDAFPLEYEGGLGAPEENSTQIHWGRIVRNISQTVHFDRTGKDVVEGAIVTHLDGALKISAPYHMSRRKRHAVLFKPFSESCVRKVFFQRSNNSSDPAKAWKLSAISAVKGGTDQTEVHIEALTMKIGEEYQRQIQSPMEHKILFEAPENGNHQKPSNGKIELDVQVRSKEMEHNIIVLRSATVAEEIVRKQLHFESDVRQEADYCQSYRGTFSPAAMPSSRSLVAEAVLRSSLYDTGAAVSTCFWVFPA